MVLNGVSRYDATKFFDGNNRLYGDIYGTEPPHKVDYFILDFINNNSSNKNFTLLDIGGGSGTFASLVCQNSLAHVTIVDPSKEMLEKIGNDSIVKIEGALPDNININSTFNYVNLRVVLHHVVGSSIDESKRMAKKSLVNIKNLLEDEGHLFVSEIYYENYVMPRMANSVIFYLCLIQNKYNVKIPVKYFLKGLVVYFYTRSELEELLNDSGYEIISRVDEPWGNSMHKQLSFIKNSGRIAFICKKR